MIKEHLLALDASTTSTGWAIYDLQTYELLESGSITPKGGGLQKEFLSKSYLHERRNCKTKRNL